ncbi:MAG: nickel-dependent lactate racemase [Desulfobacterales bacterium]|nr:nickel-dependent lactate racemase [Desulfobacterales bacterium]
MAIEWPKLTQKVTLPWGSGELSFDVPASWNLVYPELVNAPPPDPRPELEIVTDAVSNPEGALPLSGRDLAGKKVVLVVDDNTRPTPVYKFFPMILDTLEACGADLSNAKLLPALGIHTAMAKGEMEEKVGEEGLARVPWENHDAFDDAKNTEFGTTSRGTPISLNAHLKDADLILIMGLIEPHLMAGFGGGMKNILPGVAAADTIGAHHQLLTDPPEQFNRVGADPEGNNFRLDFEEVKGMIDAEIFCINVVINHERHIMAAFAGDPVGAHRKGIDYTRKAQGLHIAEQVDGIIVNSYPMDINFKQSMKCVGNSLPALKPGGPVMGFLKADKGMDDVPLPEKMSVPLFLIKLLLRIIGPKYVFALLNVIKKGLNVEEKFLYYYILQLIRAHDLFLYVPSLTDEEAEHLFYFEHCRETDDVVRKGFFKLGLDATVAIFPEGGATYPIVGSTEDLT